VTAAWTGDETKDGGTIPNRNSQVWAVPTPTFLLHIPQLILEVMCESRDVEFIFRAVKGVLTALAHISECQS
jgi:hypothetical protein